MNELERYFRKNDKRLIVIEKSRRNAPAYEMAGKRTLEHETKKGDGFSLIKKFLSKEIDKILQILRLKGFSY